MPARLAASGRWRRRYNGRGCRLRPHSLHRSKQYGDAGPGRGWGSALKVAARSGVLKLEVEPAGQVADLAVDGAAQCPAEGHVFVDGVYSQ